MKATLYIPRGEELWRWLHALSGFAAARQWEADGYVRDWTELVQLLCNGVYDIGVIPSRSMLPPERLPRLVAMDEHRQPRQPDQRPPRWIQ